MSNLENASPLPWPLRMILRLSPATRAYFGSVTARVDDSPGWMAVGGGGRWENEGRAQDQIDALEAWRKSPLARRIVSLTTDFCVGDGIVLRSEYKPLQDFITAFWGHGENRLGLRLPDVVDELSRAGEVFPVLHVQADGMSFVRFVPGADILSIT